MERTITYEGKKYKAEWPFASADDVLVVKVPHAGPVHTAFVSSDDWDRINKAIMDDDFENDWGIHDLHHYEAYRTPYEAIAGLRLLQHCMEYGYCHNGAGEYAAVITKLEEIKIDIDGEE